MSNQPNLTASQRLQLLLNVLYRVKEEQRPFGIEFWFDEEHFAESFKGDPSKPITEESLLSCGTAACAIGWLAVSPEGQALGMRPVYDGCQLWIEDKSSEPSEFLGIKGGEYLDTFFDSTGKTTIDEVIEKVEALKLKYQET